MHLVVHEDELGWSSRAATIDADLCVRLRDLVEAVPAPERRHEYVHGDLNLSNALYKGGRLTGIVDRENLGVGDRTVDLARLAFEAHRRRDEAAGMFMRAGREAGGEPGWRAAVAYEIISRLGWRGEHGYTADWNQLATLSRTFLAAASAGPTQGRQ